MTRSAPNDETQNDMLDIGSVKDTILLAQKLTRDFHSHHMLTLLLDGKLFLAPIDPNVQQVLDVGTGTGIWAM